MKLSENQKRILYLINLYTQNNQNSWIREETLLGLIYYFVKNGVFDEPYDYAPSPYLWNGEIKFKPAANSQYGRLNIFYMRQNISFLPETVIRAVLH